MVNPVNGMMELSGLASSTFARRFRQATGERPIDYIHMLRLEKAKALLEENSRNIDEIGKMVGYEDPTSFRRIFKRKIGMTPKTYRLSFGKVRFTRN